VPPHFRGAYRALVTSDRLFIRIGLTVARFPNVMATASSYGLCHSCSSPVFRVSCTVFEISHQVTGKRHMANSAQARKRARQAVTTHQRNASLKSALRTAVKKVKKAIAGGDKTVALKQLQESQAVIDRVADKKVMHKNLAARTKSRLSQAIKGMAAA
jgi:small subunit ribosomal protein S20